MQTPDSTEVLTLRAAHVAVLAVIILLSSCFLGIIAVGQDHGFSTPEETIRFFIECLKDADYERALRACAAEEMAENYDYEAMIERIGIMSPMSRYMPSEYGLYTVYNRHAQEYHIFHQLSWMVLSAVLPEEYSDFLNMYPVQEPTVDFDNIVSDMNPERITSLEIVQIGRSYLLNSERHQEYIAQEADIYGASAATSRAVLYDIDGKFYVGGIELLQYNGKWLISELSDPLIDQSPNGALIKVKSVSEFQAMLE